MGRDERVLHDVLGGELVAQQEPGEAHEPVPVGPVELGDGDVGVGRQLGAGGRAFGARLGARSAAPEAPGSLSWPDGIPNVLTDK